MSIFSRSFFDRLYHQWVDACNNTGLILQLKVRLYHKPLQPLVFVQAPEGASFSYPPDEQVPLISYFENAMIHGRDLGLIEDSVFPLFYVEATMVNEVWQPLGLISETEWVQANDLKVFGDKHRTINAQGEVVGSL